MIVRKTSEKELVKALDRINSSKYDGNLEFKRMEYMSGSRGGGETWRVTIKPKEARGPGGRLGQMGLMGYGTPRHVAAACWHAHGDFFDAVLTINPYAKIVVMGKKVSVANRGFVQGNWEDRNIGSMMAPVYYSQACHCGEKGYPNGRKQEFDQVIDTLLNEQRHKATS